MANKIKQISEIANELYLDRVNNFLTLPVFAEHYGISDEVAKIILDLGRLKQEQPAQFDFPKDK